MQEAYVKARGKGMNAIPFRSFSFAMAASAALVGDCKAACSGAADVAVQVSQVHDEVRGGSCCCHAFNLYDGFILLPSA